MKEVRTCCFPVHDFSGELNTGGIHSLILLYQPIFIETSGTLENDLNVDGVVFSAGTPMLYNYNFPFWRFSYCYNLLPGSRHELSLGASLQIRNAEIIFQDKAGTQLVRKGGTGPVPLVKIRVKAVIENGFWLAFEADGMYAPVSYLNGSNREVTGAIIDCAVSGGRSFGRYNAFITARYIAGGAVNEEPGEEVENWLQFAIFSMGISMRSGD